MSIPKLVVAAKHLGLGVLVLLMTLAHLSCSDDATNPTPEDADYTTTPSGLMFRDVKVGTGRAPRTGETVVVHYTIWLLDGTKIDSSHDRGTPFTFLLGVGSVISGFDEGVASMRVGGIRRLRIPTELAYGEDGYPPIIPPNAALDCEIELLQVRGHESLPN
jgi:peptidylprolyl isomerase